MGLTSTTDVVGGRQGWLCGWGVSGIFNQAAAGLASGVAFVLALGLQRLEQMPPRTEVSWHTAAAIPSFKKRRSSCQGLSWRNCTHLHQQCQLRWGDIQDCSLKAGLVHV